MNRKILTGRALALPLAAALMTVGLGVVATSTASAAQIGDLLLTQTNGSPLTGQNQTFDFETSAGCPSSPTDATNFQITVAGPGLTGTPNIQGNTSQSTVGGDLNIAFSGPVQQTLAGFAVAQAQPGGYLGAGDYTMTLRCRTAASSTSLGDFVATFTVTGSGASSVVAVDVPAPANDETSTALGVSPAGTVGWGAPVTLTATVTNTTGSAVPVGTVLFKDDGVAIGSAAAVNGAGVATTTYAKLAPGANDITAEFTGGAGFDNSVTASATVVNVDLLVPSVVLPATLSGSVKVGATVTCVPGTWSSATSYAYEFLKNGVAVGAPSSTRTTTLAAADLNKTLACRVTATNPIGSATSTTTAVKVALGSAAVATVKPKILFSAPAANVGETLRSSRGTWSPSATYTYNYIWKRGSTIIKQGSTATTYRATLADRGRSITLTVQAKRTGYATGTATSVAVVVK